MESNFFPPPLKRPISGLPDPNLNGSSKRPKPSVTPGQVTFRLLCNSSRIGGVIGKSGSVIKTLQQSTNSKIRIEDSPNDSPDRVITVIASGAASGGTDGRIGVSNAQEALLRVFDRILEVAVEMEGVEIGDRIVSCRLVADAAEASSVIGKGGNVVEKIKKDTGCKIRVCRDNLPACISSPDEVIEIEGSVSSIKKALVAVSHRLQAGHHADRTTMTGQNSHKALIGVPRETLNSAPRDTFIGAPRETLVAAPRETLTDLHVDHLLQRGSTLSTLRNCSNSHATGVQSLSAEVNRVSSLEPKAHQQEINFKIICSNDRIGGIIGKGGNIIRALQSETGATISVGPSVAECEDRLITIIASESPESRYSPAQKAVVLVFSRSVEAGIEKGIDPGINTGSPVTAQLVVPSNQVGCLLGKGGVVVSEMRRATGASIRIIGTDQASKCVSDNDQVVQISGEFQNVLDALFNATGRLRDNLFGGTQNSAGTKSLSSIQADTSPYGRLRDIPLGGQSSLRADTDPYARMRNIPFEGQSSLQADTGPYVRLRDVPYGGQSSLQADVSPYVRLRDVPFGGQSSLQADTSPYGRLRDVPLGGQSSLQADTCPYGRLRDVPLGGQSSLQADTSPYERLRDLPLGGQSSSQADTSPYGRLRDVPLGGQSAAGISHSQSRHTFSQGIDHFALSRTNDRPSSPGLWIPPRVAGINSRSINEASWGLPSRKGGLELISGSKSAIVTNTTIEIVVPEDTLYLVYGENGSNLARLRQISGAKVVIHEPHPGTSDRTIVLSGSPDETQAAQSLLQAFIRDGSS
ncbi:KH domain-containing protein HEN4-like [Vicia villosa]|uniref:KH domain-containing protein HEN4-like n=1 Tax=Vicia villosa TaxID=3911 RepID=UPI00273ADD8C|nr:KH domain-containing protein HEN4-like [Vicia villosa]